MYDDHVCSFRRVYVRDNTFCYFSSILVSYYLLVYIYRIKERVRLQEISCLVTDKDHVRLSRKQLFLSSGSCIKNRYRICIKRGSYREIYEFTNKKMVHRESNHRITFEITFERFDSILFFSPTILIPERNQSVTAKFFLRERCREIIDCFRLEKSVYSKEIPTKVLRFLSI